MQIEKNVELKKEMIKWIEFSNSLIKDSIEMREQNLIKDLKIKELEEKLKKYEKNEE